MANRRTSPAHWQRPGAGLRPVAGGLTGNRLGRGGEARGAYMRVQQPAWPGPCMCSMASRSPSSSTFFSRLPTSCMLHSERDIQQVAQVRTGVKGGEQACLGERELLGRGSGHERRGGRASRMPAACCAAAGPHLGRSSGVPDIQALMRLRRLSGRSSRMGWRCPLATCTRAGRQGGWGEAWSAGRLRLPGRVQAGSCSNSRPASRAACCLLLLPRRPQDMHASRHGWTWTCLVGKGLGIRRAAQVHQLCNDHLAVQQLVQDDAKAAAGGRQQAGAGRKAGRKKDRQTERSQGAVLVSACMRGGRAGASASGVPARGGVRPLRCLAAIIAAAARPPRPRPRT